MMRLHCAKRAFTTEFKYLGSIVHHFLTSDADVDKRIRPASAAFGALKNILTNKDIELKVKGSVYVALCLSILLYGSDIWCEVMTQKGRF
jgi:hypothetical protein